MKKIYIVLIASIILAAAACFTMENTGYQTVNVNGGTLYGKTMGDNKDLVVLIVAGSGPTDMDGNSTLLKGRSDSLKMIAEALAENGISSFRYDKRVTGKSIGTFKELPADFNIFVDDCTAVIRYLKSIGYKKVVLAGHSEGSLITMISAMKEPVDGYISLAGTGNRIDVTMERQLISAYGEDSDEVRHLRYLRTGKVDTSVGEDDLIFNTLNQKYLLTWMKYDPHELIGRLHIPVLLIEGEADTQANMDDYEALKTGKEDAQSLVIKDMNHELKKVTGDKENEESYTDPSYPIHEELIAGMVKFIKMIQNQ